MKIALVDSGLGLIPAAAAVRRLRPDADLVLSSDPDGMPWGPRDPQDIVEHAVAAAEAAAAHAPDVLIVACNTASVHALPALRARLEPGLPVVGTVPAIKPAAAGGGPVAIWATPATTGSAYQRALIGDFAAGVEVTEVPCPGLADAIQYADDAAIDAAVAHAAARTPAATQAVVLGCTHYELVAERIRAAVLRASDRSSGRQQHEAAPLLVLHASAGAVAAQALRRIGVHPGPAGGASGAAPVIGELTVLLSGRPAVLPAEALKYAEGRHLTAVSPVR